MEELQAIFADLRIISELVVVWWWHVFLEDCRGFFYSFPSLLLPSTMKKRNIFLSIYQTVDQQGFILSLWEESFSACGGCTTLRTVCLPLGQRLHPLGGCIFLWGEYNLQGRIKSKSVGVCICKGRFEREATCFSLLAQSLKCPSLWLFTLLWVHERGMFQSFMIHNLHVHKQTKGWVVAINKCIFSV